VPTLVERKMKSELVQAVGIRAYTGYELNSRRRFSSLFQACRYSKRFIRAEQKKVLLLILPYHLEEAIE